MNIKIALAGNPNCGKTTMYNALTGSSQYVGNRPGVTVESKEGKYKGNKDVVITDLPGIYSLSPYTSEEIITREYIINEKPDVILNIIDGSNIERNLYLTTQLKETGIPVVVAINMADVIRKRGDFIDTGKLEKELGCRVVLTSALKGEGLKEAAQTAIETAKKQQKPDDIKIFGNKVENFIDKIENIIYAGNIGFNKRWLAVKLFERDKEVLKNLSLSSPEKDAVENIISNAEKEFDDDSESIITNERYEYISKVVKKCIKKNDKNKLTISDKIDKIVTNRILALPIFACVMFLIYFLSVSTIGTMATDWVNDVLFAEWLQGGAAGFLAEAGCAEWLQGLIVDGIIGGVGAVLGFLPQMLVLFLLLAILEDCGYMARIAFIMDRIFRKFGLSGKSFIPMLIGTGCGVPGIMASRTIESENDRRMTVITTTFIPCGAKLPIIALIAGAIFPENVWIAPSAYFLGIAAIILSGIVLKRTSMFSGEPAPFVMELPAYHIPALKGVLIHMWDRGKAFVKKAGTIIFVACAIIWMLQSFNWSFELVSAEESMLASIGGFIAPIFKPLGWGDWKSAVATITGLVAKENVVGTFGVLYGVEEVAEDGVEIWANMQAAFTGVSAYSFLAFNLLCAPCFAAIGAIRREMASFKWTVFAIAYQTVLAYIVALLINLFGNAIFYGASYIPAVIVLLCVISLIVFIFVKSSHKNIKASAQAFLQE